MSNLMFFDSTLRDGSHAVKHRIGKNSIIDYCQAMDSVGMHTIIVGHGNGLGASSLQVGISLLSDSEMLTIARKNLEKTKLGAFLIPGFGTIRDDIKPAIENRVDLFCIAAHCTEADITRQHIEYIRNRGKDVYGILMMYHRASTEKLLEEALKLQSYGAMGVTIMDSAGASTPEMVKRTIYTLYNGLNIRVGFHGHNNLGLAISNTYVAIKEGASIVDGTIRGFGAGAGNCQLEALVALLKMNDIDPNLDLYRMLDTSKSVVRNIMEKDIGLTDLSIISGMSGVFSSFATQVEKSAETFQVDPRDIFLELGKQKVVGGQEDMIIGIAEKLSKSVNCDDITYQLESLL